MHEQGSSSRQMTRLPGSQGASEERRPSRRLGLEPAQACPAGPLVWRGVLGTERGIQGHGVLLSPFLSG